MEGGAFISVKNPSRCEQVYLCSLRSFVTIHSAAVFFLLSTVASVRRFLLAICIIVSAFSTRTVHAQSSSCLVIIDCSCQ